MFQRGGLSLPSSNAPVVAEGDGSTSDSQPLLELTSVDGGLVAAGQPLRIKGITWWGAESVAACPEGLDHQSIDDLLAFVSRQGFNAVRLPFLHQHVLFDEPLKTTAFSKKLNAALAPDGQPVSYTEMLLAVAQRAAAHGLLVFLVAHSVERMWYSRSIAEETVLDSWDAVARRLCGQWNVVAVDLKDKPSAASWGMGGDDDWDAAAARLGNHVLGKCPRWLIVVEGVGAKPGADQDPEMSFAAMCAAAAAQFFHRAIFSPGAILGRAILSARPRHRYPDFFDGENFVGASLHPVALKPPTSSRTVRTRTGRACGCSPMREEEFPENIEQVWSTSLPPPRPAAPCPPPGGRTSLKRDRDWQDWAVRHAAREGISLFYDSLNPASGRGGDAPSDPVVEGADGRDAAPSSAAASAACSTIGARRGPTSSTCSPSSPRRASPRCSTSPTAAPRARRRRRSPARRVYPDWLRPSPPPPPPPPCLWTPPDPAADGCIRHVGGAGAARAVLRGRLAGPCRWRRRGRCRRRRRPPRRPSRLRLADADASVAHPGRASRPSMAAVCSARAQGQGDIHFVPRAKGKGRGAAASSRTTSATTTRSPTAPNFSSTLRTRRRRHRR